MPQQPQGQWVDDDPNWVDDAKPKLDFGSSLLKGLTEGLPELQMLPPEKYPGATRQDWLGSLSRASMYPVGAATELYNKGIKPLTSVGNLGLMALSIAQPETIPITASVFGAQQAMQVPQQVRDVIKSAKETGLSGETIGKTGELGLNTLLMGAMTHGASKYKANQIGKKPKDTIKFSVEPDIVPESRRLPINAGPSGTSIPVKGRSSNTRFII